MNETGAKEIQVSGKQELAGPAEHTKPGLVFTPSVDIFESEKDITVLADMPGVKGEDLDIDLRDNTLTLIGEVIEDKSNVEDLVYAEYQIGRYYRQFSLSQVIDQEKIDAKLADGVLRLTLPKVEKAKPRQITIQTG